MSEGRTAETDGSRSFEDRVFARFDAIDTRVDRFEARFQQDLAAIDKRLEKLGAKQYETKPIWEKVLSELGDFGKMRVVARGPKRKGAATTEGNIRKVAFCPHCGNRAPQKLVHVQQAWDTGWSTEDGEVVDLPVAYFTAVCDTCKSVLLYCATGYILPEENFEMADLVYPASGALHNSIPEEVRRICREATRIRSLAPNAFAVQIRRALEALCDDRGAKKGSLEKRLRGLATKDEMASTLADITEVIRLLGNVGAHAANDEVKPWQVCTLDEFFRAVVEYVYVAPSKLKDFRDSLMTFKKKASDEQSEAVH